MNRIIEDYLHAKITPKEFIMLIEYFHIDIPARTKKFLLQKVSYFSAREILFNFCEWYAIKPNTKKKLYNMNQKILDNIKKESKNECY